MALYLLGNDLIGYFYTYSWLLSVGWLVAMGWLLLGLAAAVIGITGVARARQSAQVPRGLRVILAVLGVGFALTNVDVVLHVHGWYRLSGALFLILLAVPPLLATFLRCGHGARVALWCGWLVFTLAWKVSGIGRYAAAFNPDLTWLVWLATLAATIVLAIRRPTADADNQTATS